MVIDPQIYSRRIIWHESTYKVRRPTRHENRRAWDSISLIARPPAKTPFAGCMERTTPEAKSRSGNKYLRWLLKRFKRQCFRYDLAGYNAGECTRSANYRRHVRLYKKTQKYVRTSPALSKRQLSHPLLNPKRTRVDSVSCRCSAATE